MITTKQIIIITGTILFLVISAVVYLVIEYYKIKLAFYEHFTMLTGIFFASFIFCAKKLNK